MKIPLLTLCLWYFAKLALCFSVIATLMLLLPAPTAYAEGDPWYSDVGGHWAREYIYVLWQEDVTDGYLFRWQEKVTPYFFPDSDCTRAQFTVLLAKIFNLAPLAPNIPSYPDVPKSYEIYQGKPAWKWVEAAREAGIITTLKGRYFHPDDSMSRQDAVDLLVRCLDLQDHALAMKDQEVRSQLQRFPDGMDTREELRRSMACAIKFGIIQGYADGKLKPNTIMLRCQAATFAYRSCLIRASASLETFSPDGDGIEDIVEFSLSYLKNRGITAWNMVVEDSAGNPVFTFNPQGRAGAPPCCLVWDGTGARGETLPAGTYYYQAWVRDRNDLQFFSVKKPLNLVRYSLEGWVTPCSCGDGETITVNARTSPSAKSVTVVFADRSENLATASDGRNWTLQRLVGSCMPSGVQPINLRANFGEAIRQITLTFTKTDDLWIIPSLFPNPAGPGQNLGIVCEASTRISMVTVDLFDNTINLVKQDGLWHNTTRVPIECAEGAYPAIFRGYADGRQVSSTLYLRIDTTEFGKLVFTLTR